MDKQKYIKELEFCLQHRETKWSCTFWWWTKCEQCGAPYLLWKFISREILHWDINRLSLHDWNQKLKELKNN